ncbi:chromosome partitioning protein ParB [Pseudomonas sp. IB20]|uniref:ParB/RepB/Spo0J family partition protein n=2 Tax=unclassified Pseudomonas TaxID=196821 RepID=UPI000BA17CB8|nr:MULTISPECIES: ParB/RepB/Spo0J family partition protein [unclassified Pseudomonas]MCV2226917.1 ParB/RepB/Spo0J family partition protein [Pseudomonas sp. AU10]OZO01358.1 chromosome partitioning protein ParB [Pseudomonas sp. IB20]WKV17792.1 Chromosome (plasmid) partitioning protein ParB [Pseudomonas sp. AU10]
MKSTDFPGKTRTQTMVGLRQPEPIPGVKEGAVSRSSARAEMLKKAGINNDETAGDSQANKPLEGEWLSGNSVLSDIPLADIVKSKYQPRMVFDEKAIDELATSIQAIGLGKPILVRPLPNGKFELIGGERRWRSVQLLGWTTIQALVREMSDGVAMLLALTDNNQEDLSDYELGRSYHRILENGEEQSQRALARRLGVNVSTVSRCLSLMQLSEKIRSVLDTNPTLITGNYAKKFLEFSKTHLDLVETTVISMAKDGVQQEAALRHIEKEIAATTKLPESAKLLAGIAFEGLGKLKIVGARVEFKCVKGVNPELLSQHFEKFLRTLDPAEVVKTSE